MGGRLFFHQLCNCDKNNSVTHSSSEDNCVTFHPNAIFVFCVKSLMFYLSPIHFLPIYRQQWHHDWRRTRGDTCCSQLSSSVNRGWWNWVKFFLKKRKNLCGICLKKCFKRIERKAGFYLCLGLVGSWITSALELYQDGYSSLRSSVISPKSCSYLRGPQSKNPEACSSHTLLSSHRRQTDGMHHRNK